MRPIALICCTLLLPVFCMQAQVGIGTTNPNATLDIRSSNQNAPTNTDGILIPKVDAFPLTNPTATQNGMLVFVTGVGVTEKGFYYWDATITNWRPLIGVKKINDLIDGKSDANGASVFLGVDAGLNDDGDDNRNVGIGYQALYNSITGEANVANGYRALYNNTTGFRNVANGIFALANNTTGSRNVATGFNALVSSSTNSFNVAIGSRAFELFVNGNYNVAVGNSAAFNFVSGENNIFLGKGTGGNLHYGDNNIFIGTAAGRGTAVDTKSGSVYIGYYAGENEINSNRLYIENSNSTTPLIYGEFDNDVLGFNANVGVGTQAPQSRLHVTEEGTSGVQTIVAGLASNTSNRPVLQFSETNDIGLSEGMSLEYNGTGANFANRMVINDIGGNPLFEFRNGGSLTLREGDLIIQGTATDRELRIADDAGNNDRALMRQTGSQDIYAGDIDDNGGNFYLRAGGSTEITILAGTGNVGVNTQTPAHPFEVNGNAAKPGSATWIVTSDKRLKQNINTYTDGLETLLKINPVTYHYNALSGFDQNPEYIGVIAQELQEIAPYMVTNYKKEAVDYMAVDNSAMTYMLINAVKTQQEQITLQKGELASLKNELKLLREELKQMQTLLISKQ